MKSKKWRIGTILLAVVILAGVVTGAAFANADPSNNPAKGNLYQNFVSKFAANLGVDQDKVTAALDTTKKQMLDEAVQQGKLTQEQADKIAANKGFEFGRFGYGHDKGYNFKAKSNAFRGQGRNLDGVASALGLTTDQLKTDMQAGKKIQDIVTEQGMTMDQFNQKMLELKKEAITKAVADGKMTQDQANKILQNMEQHFKNPGFTQDKQPTQ